MRFSSEQGPLAVTGQYEPVTRGKTVLLDASRSMGRITSYRWHFSLIRPESGGEPEPEQSG